MRHSIDAAHIAFFEENGYLHIPGVIRDEELRHIQTAADAFLAMSVSPVGEWAEDFKYGDLVGSGQGAEDTLCRIEYPFGKSELLLALVAHPTILEFAYRVYGEPGVVTWEDMIVKIPSRGVAVPLHQDTLHQSTRSTVFSIGVYIDDSTDNPLIVYPRTQRRGVLADEELQQLASDPQAESRIVAAQAGDLIVHNVLMVHGSGCNWAPKPRRVIYFEFRTPEQLAQDSPWSESWIRERARYVPAAIAMRRRLYGEASVDEQHARWWTERFGAESLQVDARNNVNFRMHHEDIEVRAVPTVS